jgi:hypothetical protein
VPTDTLFSVTVTRISPGKFGSSSAARAGSLQIPPGRRLCGLLSVWYWQHGHDLDGVARENRKVRMPLEEFGRGLV